jgi:hypothetical protein
MLCPSEKSLIARFGLDRTQAKLVRQLAHTVDDGDALRKLIDEKCPETAKYAASCHNDPFDTDIWRVTMVLHAIDKIVGGHGVQGLGPGRRGDYAPPYEYVNFGDPYVTTLIYSRADGANNLYIGSWGPIAERHPDW